VKFETSQGELVSDVGTPTTDCYGSLDILATDCNGGSLFSSKISMMILF